MTSLTPAVPGCAVRILATSDLGAATVPLRTSHGESGTCGGDIDLLERERERQPTVWLDAGDLVVGHPSYPVLGERPWSEVADLPISAAAAGNHDFDDGVDALLAAARALGFPLLCANADVGLPPSAAVQTPGGTLGVIGLTHPQVDRLSSAPTLHQGWAERVDDLARDLRGAGARWVVALLHVHDGVTWWPTGGDEEPTATRTNYLEDVARPWARHVDLVLSGHNFGAWTGRLAATPAAEPHLFATSLVVVDLADRAVVRGASSGSCPSNGWRGPARRGTCPTSSRALSSSRPGPRPDSSCRASTASRRRWTARSPRSLPGR